MSALRGHVLLLRLDLNHWQLSNPLVSALSSELQITKRNHVRHLVCQALPIGLVCFMCLQLMVFNDFPMILS